MLHILLQNVASTIGGIRLGAATGGWGWAIPAATTLAKGAYDWYLQNKQKNQISDLEKNNTLPTMGIPQGDQDALASAKTQASMTRLAGQSGIEGRNDAATAGKINEVERLSPGGATAINAAGSAFDALQTKNNELGTTAASNWDKNQSILRGEQHNIGNLQQKAWDWNTGAPYMRNLNAINNLKGAQLSNENTMYSNLIGGLGYAGLGAAGLAKYFGKGTGSNSYTDANGNQVQNTNVGNNGALTPGNLFDNPVLFY